MYVLMYLHISWLELCFLCRQHNDVEFTEFAVRCCALLGKYILDVHTYVHIYLLSQYLSALGLSQNLCQLTPARCSSTSMGRMPDVIV